MKRVTKDFETRSACDLKKAGAFNYSLDPSTQPTCLSFKILGEPTVYLLDFEMVNRPWKKLPEKLKDMWVRFILEGYQFSAHNSFFERCIYDNILVPRYGWPKIPPRQRRCTAAKAAACALPRNLEGAGEALHLSTQKDKRGYAAMMATCKPTKYWNAWNKLQQKVKSGARINEKSRLKALEPEPKKFLDPEDAPDVWQTLYTYCKIDVRTEELLDQTLPDLIPAEQEVWFLNQELNWRGLRVDLPTIEKIVGIMEVESKTKLSELDSLTMGLVSKPGARQSILDFLALDGIVLDNIRSKTVDDSLGGFALTEDARKLLEIRKALSMTSTKKFYAFMHRALHKDNRVRDILLYHGASTGRDTGTGIQPQNFPRGLIRVDKARPYAAVENVIECDHETLKMLYGESLGVLFSALLRNMIMASEGHELFVADFSKIEVAVLWWLCENAPGLKILRAGLDPYKYMAAANTGKAYEEIADEGNDRQLGKAQILGCFTKDTKVLTPRGWVSLISVKISDKVWDGNEWVTHQGLKYQGQKKVIKLFGVKLTPEHLLLTRLAGWQPAEAVRKENRQSPLSVLGLVDLPSSGIGRAFEADLWQLRFNAIAGLNLTKCKTTIFSKVKALNVILALRNRRAIGRKNIILTKKKCQTMRTERGFLIVCPPQSLVATIQKIKDSTTTAGAELRFAKSGVKIEGFFLPTFNLAKIGTILNLKWTELKTKKATAPAISVLFRVRTICLTAEKFLKCKIESWTLSPVYDLVNAGPRNRFTILTTQGPVIAHNCGFGMGAAKFQTTAWDMFRLKLTEEQSKLAVMNYRQANAAVPELWKTYERAAVAAVEHQGETVKAGKCKFRVFDKFLWAELPSGRRLAYREPQISWRETDYGPRKTLEFWAVNSKTKKWSVERTWGGTLTENIVQAVARDLMMGAIVRLEKSGYKALLTIHDEAICEKPIGEGDLKTFTKIMTAPPKWADGLPLEAKGWVGERYRK